MGNRARRTPAKVARVRSGYRPAHVEGGPDQPQVVDVTPAEINVDKP